MSSKPFNTAASPNLPNHRSILGVSAAPSDSLCRTTTRGKRNPIACIDEKKACPLTPHHQTHHLDQVPARVGRIGRQVDANVGAVGKGKRTGEPARVYGVLLSRWSATMSTAFPASDVSMVNRSSAHRRSRRRPPTRLIFRRFSRSTCHHGFLSFFTSVPSSCRLLRRRRRWQIRRIRRQK